MRSLFACLLFLLLSSPASAALLAEFSWHDTRTVGPGAVYSISTFYSPTGPNAYWTSTSSGANETFLAPADKLADFNSVWTNGLPGWWNALYMSHTYAGSSHTDIDAKFGVGLDLILRGHDNDWRNGGLDNWHGFYGTRFVEERGQQFHGYELTSVERSVTPLTHTIRVYGEAVPIPEPAAIVLVITVLVAAAGVRGDLLR